MSEFAASVVPLADMRVLFSQLSARGLAAIGELGPCLAMHPACVSACGSDA